MEILEWTRMILWNIIFYLNLLYCVDVNKVRRLLIDSQF